MKYPLNVGDSFKNTYGNRTTVQRVASNDEVTLLTDKNTKYTEHKHVLKDRFDAGMYTDFIFSDGSLNYKDVVQGNVYKFNHEDGSYLLGQFYYEGYISVDHPRYISQWRKGMLRCTNRDYHHKIMEATNEESDWYYRCRNVENMVPKKRKNNQVPPAFYKAGDEVRIIEGGHYFTERGLENPAAGSDNYKTGGFQLGSEGSIVKYAYSHLHKKWYYKLDNRGNMISEDGLELIRKTKPTMPRAVKTKPKFKSGDYVRIVAGGNYVISSGIEHEVALSKDLQTTNGSAEYKYRVESSKYSHLHDLWWYKIEGHGNMYSEPGLELYKEVKAEPATSATMNDWASVEPATPQPKSNTLVFGEYQVGQLVRSLEDLGNFRTRGNFYAIQQGSTEEILYYIDDVGDNAHSTSKDSWTHPNIEVTNIQPTADNYTILSNLAEHELVGSAGSGGCDSQDIIIPLHTPVKLESNPQVDLVTGPTKFASVKLEEDPENNYLTL